MLNDLLLDFNALNRIESLPWDDHALTARGYDRLSTEQLELLDRVAAAVVDADFARLRGLFRAEPSLRQ